jgi:hypothetical protein
MQPARQSTWLTVLELVLAIILPIVGLVFVIVLLTSGRRQEATIVLVGTVVGAAMALALYL